MAAMGGIAQLANLGLIDDGGAVDPEEFEWIELVFQRLHGFAHQEGPLRHINAHIIAHRPDPFDPRHIDPGDAAPVADPEFLLVVITFGQKLAEAPGHIGLPGRLDLPDHGPKILGLRGEGLLVDPPARPLDRPAQPVHFDRL